jgi:hypothetical protein
MDGLYGDMFAEDDDAAPPPPQRPAKRKRDVAGGSGPGFHCAVCAEWVSKGSVQEHERSTLHRFNMFAETPHDDRSTQAAAEPAAVRAAAAAAAAAAEARSEAAQLAAQRQSVGYKMLKLAGWKEGEGLGLRSSGATAPVPTRLVKGRPGLERHLAQPARVTHKPRSVRAAAPAAGGGGTAKAPGTRGERRAARTLAAAVEKKEEARMRDALSLGAAGCEGNSGPLWRNRGKES